MRQDFNMADVGRPSELTEEIIFKIRTKVLQGCSYKEIQEMFEFSPDTWDGWMWRNYKGLRDTCNSARRERMLQKAESNIEALQEADDDKVRLQANIFVAETIGKHDYSKKTETDLTSAGKPIFIPSEIAEKNKIDTAAPEAT